MQSQPIDNLEPSREEQARSLSRQEFCALERMSLSTYAKLQRKGLGPAELRFPGLVFATITPEARREWRARFEEYSRSKAAKLEDERRRALASKAGRLAAKSPLHVSKAGKVSGTKVSSTGTRVSSAKRAKR